MQLTQEEMVSKVEKLEGTIEQLEALVTKLTTQDAGDDAGDDDAGDDDAQDDTSGDAEVAKRNAEMVEIRKALDEAKSRADRAETIAKAERDARVLSELVSKADREFSSLPGTAAEKAQILKALQDKLEASEQEAVLNLLRAGEQAMKQAMAPVGKSSGAASASDAWAAIEQAAVEIRKADAKMSQAEAISKAVVDNPKLYQQYLADTSRS